MGSGTPVRPKHKWDWTDEIVSDRLSHDWYDWWFWYTRNRVLELGVGYDHLRPGPDVTIVHLPVRPQLEGISGYSGGNLSH